MRLGQLVWRKSTGPTCPANRGLQRRGGRRNVTVWVDDKMCRHPQCDEGGGNAVTERERGGERTVLTQGLTEDTPAQREPDRQRSSHPL